jgi:hypothetical protein
MTVYKVQSWGDDGLFKELIPVENRQKFSKWQAGLRC